MRGEYLFNFMKRLLLSLLFVVPLFAFAQSNFQKGYVVTPAKDTLRGYIDYKERAVNPKSFNFRSQPNSETQQFNTNNTTEVVINETIVYQVFAVNISTSEVNISQLSSSPDFKFRRDTVFLKVLQAGTNINLYAYRDQLKLRFYSKDNSSAEPVELIRQLYLKDGGVLMSIDSYRRQLLAAIGKLNPAKEQQLSRFLKYEETDLVKAVALINNQEVGKPTTPPIRFFAGIGLNAGKAKYHGTNLLANTAAVSTTSYLPAINAGIDMFANPEIGKLIYRAELSFSMSKNKVSTTTSDQANAALSQSFDQFNVALTPQVIYNLYNKENLKAFIGIGAAINFATYSNNRLSRYNSFRNDTEESSDMTEFEKLYFSIPAVAGVVINKNIEIAIGYSLPAAITNYSSYDITMQRMRIGVNYLFGKL